MKAVDLFAGGGGSTAGAELAGARVVWAANHWGLAVDVHRANHPGAVHSCQDLQQADFSLVPDHDLLMASPSCVGHTKARGAEAKHHDAERSTAWAVVTCAEVKRPPALVVENVPEFLGWSLYPVWKRALEVLGYRLEERVLDAADFGVPQNRRRVFVLGTLDGVAAELPGGGAQGGHTPARAFLDFEGGRWSAVEKPGRAAATLARVARGREEQGSRFVMPYYGRGSGKTGRSIDRPLGTVTCVDGWAVVDGERMRMLTVDEYRAAMGFPEGYRLDTRRRSEAIRLLGNAVCPPVMKAIVEAVAKGVAA